MNQDIEYRICLFWMLTYLTYLFLKRRGFITEFLAPMNHWIKIVDVPWSRWFPGVGALHRLYAVRSPKTWVEASRETWRSHCLNNGLSPSILSVLVLINYYNLSLYIYIYISIVIYIYIYIYQLVYIHIFNYYIISIMIYSSYHVISLILINLILVANIGLAPSKPSNAVESCVQALGSQAQMQRKWQS